MADSSAENTIKVSYWHIPNGSDYHHAEVRTKEFSDLADAERFAKQYEMPPEMAHIIRPGE